MNNLATTYTETEKATIQKALDILTAKHITGRTKIESPGQIIDWLKLNHAGKEREQFDIIFLDSRHHIIGYETLFLGTINGASVYPREVVKRSLELNAGLVILSHNHPSGVAEPSTSDEIITTKIIDALRLVDIKVLDHIVTAGGEYVSLSDRGLM